MSVAAGFGSMWGNSRPADHFTWASPASYAKLLRPKQAIRPPGGCPLMQAHQQQFSPGIAVSALTTPPPASPWSLQRRPLTPCAATKSEGVRSEQRRPMEPRLPDAAADPRDGDEGPRNTRRQEHYTPRPAASRAAVVEEGVVEDGFLDDNDDADDVIELAAEGEFEEGDDAGAGEEGEYDEEDEGADEDEDEDEDYAASFLDPDDAPREVATGGTAWGEVVLRAIQEVLAQPAMKGLEVYLFRALPAGRKVDIRLDKLDDLYGSPSIDDIERFQRSLFAVLDREMGPEAAGEISFEVSSPGAERLVRVPDELTRFAELPLQVEYRTSDDKDVSSVLLFVGLDEAAGLSSWRLANVRANATVKGRALSKRQLAQLITVPLAQISRVRIHVNF
ncbi:hypothetical protein Vretimale_1345 [Volvox reticuliferus]|uniref:DUF7912 domain-containing protein n=1 Tax=Volvox reticuliferus TaxID=1737510 RepID=A0A8J4CMZ9_9CHLO|nr:hypothetical protein Vretifemale_10723 [Volvox reticuliferus]GIL95266.1 hypothetical protein Vretimale_1345 [Volvox reticuliferus]